MKNIGTKWLPGEPRNDIESIRTNSLTIWHAVFDLSDRTPYNTKANHQIKITTLRIILHNPTNNTPQDTGITPEFEGEYFRVE
jgi:hypothetical protein